MKFKTGLKQSDLAMLILVVAIAMTVAYLAGNALINTPESRSVKVESANEFNAEFIAPDSKVYAEGYINPTELIQIGNGNNKKPFGSE